MTIGYGILLFILGITFTMIGLFLAYFFGSRPKLKKEQSSKNALTEFYNRNKLW